MLTFSVYFTVKDNKSSFDSLVADIKRRQEAARAKKSSTASTSGPSTSSSSLSIVSEEVRDEPHSSNKQKSSPQLHSPNQPGPLLESPSPCVPTHSESSPSSSPSRIEESPDVHMNSSVHDTQASIKSPILGKRKLFTTNQQSAVIEISDDGDSDCTVFSEADFDQIDALTQRVTEDITKSKLNETAPSAEDMSSFSSNETIPSSQEMGMTNGASSSTNVMSSVPPNFLQCENSTDSDDAFQAPKKISKTPVSKPVEPKKKAKKREIPPDQNSEPRRSSRKKPRR